MQYRHDLPVILRTYWNGDGQRAGEAAGDRDIPAQQEHVIIIVHTLAYRTAGGIVAQHQFIHCQRRVPVYIAGHGDTRRTVSQRTGDIVRLGITAGRRTIRDCDRYGNI